MWGIGSLRSAQAAAHNALDAECAAAAGQAYGEAMIDLTQAYERMDHTAPAVALANGPLPPPTVAELLLLIYRAPRSLRSAGATSPWVAPKAGIVAGCPLADSALRCVMQGRQTTSRPLPPGITTRAYADDVKFSARGDPTHVAQCVAAAVRTWDLSASAFGGVLSRSKCTLSANTPHAGRKLLAATAGEGIPW